MIAKSAFSGCCWQSTNDPESAAPHRLVDENSFKAAMRRLATGVAVVTSSDGVGSNGMTATAICSVSAAPPLVVAVINRASRSNALIRQTGVFAVNLLSEDQRSLAMRFAASSNKSFGDTAHWIGQTGCPILEGCVAALECMLHSAHEVATHTMFVGRVVNVLDRPAPPLIHHDGTFARLR
jgi:flavin reductase (DIM6/NTAB) family NADH-FMN oxidoreductase RutF